MSESRKGVKIVIKTLEPGWHDKAELMLHAMLQLLTDFMEKEKPGEVTDWTSDAAHRKAWDEMNKLDRWWKKERPARRSPLRSRRLRSPPLETGPMPGTSLRKSAPPDKKKYAAYYRAMEVHWRLEKEWEAEDQKNLHRLVDIRRFLWT